MLMLNWPIIVASTIILYLLTILVLPFSPERASVFLFAIVALWSRLPGVGMPSPMYILYFMDLVDFFSLIIAINIGGIEGAIFTICLNLGSRVVGVFPSWLGVCKDAIAQGITCLIIPFVHALTGQDIFITMIWYSVIRILLFIPMRILPTETTLPQFIVMIFAGGTAQLVINAAYVKLFGSFFNSLLQKGVEFNWLLFLVVTAVILIFYISVFNKSKTIRTLPYLKMALRCIMRKLFLGRRHNPQIARKGKNSLEAAFNASSDDMEDMRRIKDTVK